MTRPRAVLSTVLCALGASAVLYGLASGLRSPEGGWTSVVGLAAGGLILVVAGMLAGRAR